MVADLWFRAPFTWRAARSLQAQTPIRFANTRHTLAVMERVAACIRMVEPVLLVGETGTGKTTVVQQLARSMGKTM